MLELRLCLNLLRGTQERACGKFSGRLTSYVGYEVELIHILGSSAIELQSQEKSTPGEGRHLLEQLQISNQFKGSTGISISNLRLLYNLLSGLEKELRPWEQGQ